MADVYFMRAKVLLGLSKTRALTHDEKVAFRNDLDHFITKGGNGDKKELAEAYRLRAEVFSGLHPEVCGKNN